MLALLNTIGRLPKPVLYALSQCIYLLLCHVFRYRYKTITKNLLLAFPEKTQKERTLLLKAYYKHLSEVLVEIVMLAHMNREELLQCVTITGKEYMQALVDKNQSFLIMSAHQANWEWMVAAISQSCPCPMDAIYRPVHNKTVDDFFRQIRTRFCSNMLPANLASKAIIKCRKTVRAFGIIADQNPRRHDDKYWINFLGVPTAVFPGPDRIARITAYPVLFVSTEKQGRGRYHCTITPLAEPPYEQEELVARRYMQAVEQQIRQQPALWMWSHQRWRYQQKDCPPS